MVQADGVMHSRETFLATLRNRKVPQASYQTTIEDFTEVEAGAARLLRYVVRQDYDGTTFRRVASSVLRGGKWLQVHHAPLDGMVV